MRRPPAAAAAAALEAMLFLVYFPPWSCLLLQVVIPAIAAGSQTSSNLTLPIPAPELQALLEFKAHIANTATSKELLRAWNATNSHNICKSWEGVTCILSHSGHHHIGRINLAGSGLAGSLPPQLGNLSLISTLNLSSNHLTGGIPTELSGCSLLQVLDLNNNSLTGPVPPSFSSLSKIQVLRLCQNHLSGVIPPPLFTNCTSLLKLSLCDNALTGSIPTITSWHLAKLQHLLLWRNYLTGTLPPSLANCSSLVYLELYSNQLSGPIPSELGSLVQLTHLLLYENRLSGVIPASLGRYSNLRTVDLGANQLTGGIPSELGSSTNLTVLLLYENNLTGHIPSSLGNCSLVHLEIFSNHLSGPIPNELGLLVELQSLYLNDNYLIGGIPHSLGNCTSLLEIKLQSNQLSGTLSITTNLAQLQRLQKLNLSYNQFSGDIPWNSLSNCSQLYQLDLSHNHLTGGLSGNFLGRLSKLRGLYLQNNLLQGTIPNLGGNLSLQEDVDLSFNQLNGSLPDSLATVLTQVISLDISHNDLMGNLPSWLGQLEMVQSIDLSHNRFMGIIPGSLGASMSLINLNLSNNNLVGEFLQHLGNNSNLISLDLSSNQLTGVLLSTLEHLQQLRFLNVSFNNFEGPIPRLGVFKHLDASCFQGNPGLCGQIIQKPCMPYNHAHLSWKIWILIVAAILVVAATTMAICCYRYHHSKGRLRIKVDQGFKSLREIKHFSAKGLSGSTQGYSEMNLIGEGAMGMVYKGVLSNGEIIAVKKFRDGVACSREALLQEMQILSKLRHRNLVKVLGCALNLEVNALVLEFMPNGSLEQYLSQAAHEEEGHERLSWPMVLKIAQGVANALAYLHHEYETVPIIHGDVKPSNILLDFELEAHLADFGLAKLAKRNTGAVSLTSNFKGSIGYMAPEFAYAAKITSKVDIYSFGVVILEMLTGRGPTNEHLQGVSLPKWVKQKLLLHGGVNLQEVVFASLLQCSSSSTESDYIQFQLGQLLQMALACTEELPSKRPTMQHIKAFLESQKGIPAVAVNGLHLKCINVDGTTSCTSMYV